MKIFKRLFLLLLISYLLFSCATTQKYSKYKIERSFNMTLSEDVKVKVTSNDLVLKFNNRVEKYDIERCEDIYSKTSQDKIGLMVVVDNGVLTMFYDNFSIFETPNERLVFSKPQ